MPAASIFFDEFIFSWQRITTKMYPMRDSWMKETRKLLPEVSFKTQKNIRGLTCVYEEISDILEELLGACYFDNVDSILKEFLPKLALASKNHMTIVKKFCK